MAHAVDGLRRRLFGHAQGGLWTGQHRPVFATGYVAMARGLFDGLDVECLNSQSGPRTNQLLAAGQIMFGATAARRRLPLRWLVNPRNPFSASTAN